MKTTLRRTLTILMFIVVVSAPVQASNVTVMTRNLYLGADLGKVLAARTTPEFLSAVSRTFGEVQATNFPERAQGLADEIARSKPDLIGLQEVAMWRSQFPADFSPTPNASTIEYDFLELLIAALAEKGVKYSPAVIAARADIEAPGLTPVGIKEYRLTMRDVILIRTEPDVHDAVLSNIMEKPYVQNLVITTFVGPVVFTRGWASADVSIDDEKFRFINTHLEAFVPSIRLAQAAELLTGPANTELPVILVGDFNSTPGSAPYNLFTNAGFLDAWRPQAKKAVTSGEEDVEGFTCCQAADLRNEESTLSVRIDLVLYRGNIAAGRTDVVGDRQKDRSPSGLWSSDHAGVVARLKLDEMDDED